jgi:3-oxoacyl-[acyl-carrier protein] reductase
MFGKYFLVGCLVMVATSTDAFTINKPTSVLSRISSSPTSLQLAPDAKVVMVTGSSRGLGKAVALEIGKYGQKVVINYVSDSSKAAADEVVEEIKALGGDALAVQADSKYLLNL